MKKWHTVFLALSLVALIAASGFLYSTLKNRAENHQLMALAPTEQTESTPEQTESIPEQTQPARQETEPTDAVEMTAPDFTVYDGEGNAVTLESLRGKPVVLNFWATWCPPCRAEMPEIQEIYEEYGIIGMSVAVFDDGEIIYTENLGYADREQKIPCNDNTRYRIASISKVISTIGVMKMADNGDISLDTKLAEATGIEYDWVYSSGTVELKHLLTHTAGLIDTWRFENHYTDSFFIQYRFHCSFRFCQIQWIRFRNLTYTNCF